MISVIYEAITLYDILNDRTKYAQLLKHISYASIWYLNEAFRWLKIIDKITYSSYRIYKMDKRMYILQILVD